MADNYVNKDPSDIESKVGTDLNQGASSGGEKRQNEGVDAEFKETLDAYEDEEELKINPDVQKEQIKK